MTPFIIVADLRTGSTLLSSSLERHPEIRCYGELLHTEDFPDNQLEHDDRHQLDAKEVIRKAYALKGYEAIGFRAMVFLPLPSRPKWADAWEQLREIEGLHVIYLHRKNQLAQYTSLQVAQKIGVFHPSPEDPVLEPENRPTINIPPEEFRAWAEHRQQLYARRRAQLSDKPSLELDYESLTSTWVETMAAVQDFLGVTPMVLEQMKYKQERRPLSDIISNYDELVDMEVA